MKDIESVIEHYPDYIHRYYSGECEIDFCTEKVTSVYLMQSGESVPMCGEHSIEYRNKAKCLAPTNALVDKNWTIELTGETAE